MKKIFVALYKTVLVRCLLIVVLTFLVFSCGDNLTEEHFVDIEPPADISTIDLRLQGTSHSIKIFKPTQLNYKIGDGTTKIYSAKYSLEEQSWTVYSNESTININPNDYSPGSHKLKLNLVMGTGTNSIADNKGFEKYVIQKEWDLIIDGREAPSLKPVASISKDSLLVIKWPKADHYDFKYYEISANSGFRNISKKIKNVNDTIFSDPLYAGEAYSFTVDCITGNSRSYGSESSIALPKEEPQLYIEEIGYEELRVSWDRSKYKAKYKLNINYNPSVFFEKSADTTYTIKQTGFGDLNTFSLSVKSQYNNWDDYDFMLQTKKRYRLGTDLNLGNWPKFAYNFVEKVFYTNDYNRMQSFNLNSFQNISTIRLDNLLYEGIYSCPTNSTRVAGASDDKIYVFENKDLENPVEISYDGGGTDDIDHFLFSDNGKIAFSRSGTYHLLDIESKKEILQIPIDDYPIYSKWAKISTSQDAKFMGVGTHNGLKIYRLGTKAEEIFSDTRTYGSVYFNPLNASELYLTFNDNQVLEVRNPSDFSLNRTINLETKMVIENIDPVSNKILLTNYKRLFIYDLTSGELELSLPGTESQNWLFNYHLFCNTGCVLNIEKELN